MQYTRAIALVLTVGFSLACGDLMDQVTGPPPEPLPAPKPEGVEERAARIGNSLRKDPANTATILRAEGTTEAEFEKLLYDIARDPARTKVYLSALEGR